jgi:hypothetical protein
MLAGSMLSVIRRYLAAIFADSPMPAVCQLQPHSSWSLKQFGFHVDFAEFRDTAT